MASNPPEITLEIDSGSLTIRTAEAIYHVLVVGGRAGAAPVSATPVLAPAPPRPALAPLAEPPSDLDREIKAAQGAPEDEEYYRELSKDMYKEVGRLARRLSMSIRDVTIDKVDDLHSAGDQLESAKDELEKAVKMTERATLKIMDLTEGIQDAVSKTKKVMQQLDGNVAPEASPAATETEAAPDLSQLGSFLQGLKQNPLAECLDKAQELVAALQSAPAGPAVAAPAAQAGPAYDFPLDLVFQTMYELCTNEAVKKHVKAMWDTAEQTFDPVKLEAGLNQVAAQSGGPDEDNFLNLSLKEVLKSMFQATAKENFQQILKKMASTADQIFLEPSLPLEAMPKAQDAAPAATSAPAPAQDNGPALSLANALLQALQAKANTLNPPDVPDLSQLGGAAGGCVNPALLAQLHDSMGEIFGHVNEIVETLSFQDLAGQTIYKTVKMLTDFQVQILALLVGFGTKLKTKEEAPAKVDAAQSEAMAQEEVDKALTAVGAKEGDGEDSMGKLNQDSVNDLLGSLGF